jgi:endonuclease YncB( thermonuclease family)
MYEYQGTLVRVVDGDTVVLSLKRTISVDVDFGFYVKDKLSLEKSADVTFRLKGINTPEIVGTDKARGLDAKARLQELLESKPLRVISYKTDKYGRWLADIFIIDRSGIEKSVCQLLVEEGHAVPYMT